MTERNNTDHQTHAIPAQKTRAKIICISSGKGGVGKTLSVVHLALFARKLGKKVLILSGDFGHANANIVLGMNTGYNKRNYSDETCSLKDRIQCGPCGIQTVVDPNALSHLQDMTFKQKRIFQDELNLLREEFDLIILDTSSGFGNNVLFLNQLADRNILISTSEPHTLVDHYVLVEALQKHLQIKQVFVIMNLVKTVFEGEKIAASMSAFAKSAFDISINCLGTIPFDPLLSRYILRENFGSENSTKTLSFQAWGHITHKILNTFETHTNIKKTVSLNVNSSCSL